MNYTAGLMSAVFFDKNINKLFLGKNGQMLSLGRIKQITALLYMQNYQKIIGSLNLTVKAE